MKKYITATLVLLLTAGSVYSQHENTGAVDFTSYRPLGEVKAWTFVAKDSVIGQLFSTVKRKTDINGVTAIEIDQNLDLDYNKIGTERKVSIRNNHYISESGAHLGDKMEITVNNETEKMEFEFDENKLTGFYTRSGNEVDREIDFSPGTFAADLMFLDLYETFFAMRSFTEGDTIRDSVYVPQTMLFERVTAIVERFGYVSLYNQLRDSTFIIRMVHPQTMVLYFNKQRQLVKADYLARQMKAYLDIVQNLPPEILTKPSFTFTKFISLVPYYSMYLLFGVIGIMFFAGTSIHRLNLYIFVIAGGLVFIAAIYTQIPLQTYLGKDVYMYNVNNGGSPFFWGVIPALPAGIIQELLKLLLILVALKHLNIERKKLLFYGAAIGAGFGIVEGAYIVSQIGAIELWSMNLVERGFMILYHIASGVILAFALRNYGGTKLINIAIAVLANTWLRYIPVFAQEKVIDPQMVYILQPILPIILVMYCISLIKRQES